MNVYFDFGQRIFSYRDIPLPLFTEKFQNKKKPYTTSSMIINPFEKQQQPANLPPPVRYLRTTISSKKALATVNPSTLPSLEAPSQANEPPRKSPASAVEKPLNKPRSSARKNYFIPTNFASSLGQDSQFNQCDKTKSKNKNLLPPRNQINTPAADRLNRGDYRGGQHFITYT